MYLSTLRSHIEAMGGQLEVVASFPDGALKISPFADRAAVFATERRTTSKPSKSDCTIIRLNQNRQ
jgi:hypothetical protein